MLAWLCVGSGTGLVKRRLCYRIMLENIFVAHIHLVDFVEHLVKMQFFYVNLFLP